MSDSSNPGGPLDGTNLDDFLIKDIVRFDFSDGSEVYGHAADAGFERWIRHGTSSSSSSALVCGSGSLTFSFCNCSGYSTALM